METPKDYPYKEEVDSKNKKSMLLMALNKTVRVTRKEFNGYSYEGKLIKIDDDYILIENKKSFDIVAIKDIASINFKKE